MAEGCELNVKGRYMYPSWNQTGGGAEPQSNVGSLRRLGERGSQGKTVMPFVCRPRARAYAALELYRYSTGILSRVCPGSPRSPGVFYILHTPRPREGSDSDTVSVPSTAPSRRSVQTIFTRACRPEGRGTPQECRPMFFPRIATFSTAPFAKLASDRRSCILCRASS